MPKNILRQKLRKLLQQMSKEERSEKSKKACLNLVSTEQFIGAKVIMMFLSLPDEVDTTDAIQFAFQQGKTVVVPKVFRKEKYMMPVRLNSLDDEFTIEFATLRNPVSDVFVELECIDLVVTPALGFDLKGHRLGRSGGFYDRFFANERSSPNAKKCVGRAQRLRAVRCGLGFEEQVLRDVFVPAVSTDIPLDFLVTDEKIRYFGEDSQNATFSESQEKLGDS